MKSQLIKIWAVRSKKQREGKREEKKKKREGKREEEKKQRERKREEEKKLEGNRTAFFALHANAINR